MHRILSAIYDTGCMLIFIAAMLFAYTVVGDMDEAAPKEHKQ